jgi:hypothetical protein
MNGDAIDRLHRWADNLSITESIPINESEMFEIADHFVMFERFQNDDAKRFILAQLRSGTFDFGGHKVVVLRESEICYAV